MTNSLVPSLNIIFRRGLFYLNSFIYMKSLKSHMFNISELGNQLLVASIGLVKLDIVHSDLGGMDEGNWDLGGVETSHIQPNQQIRAGMNFDRVNLKQKFSA